MSKSDATYTEEWEDGTGQQGQAGRTQRDPVLIRNKQLCSTCQEKKMVRPTTVVIPDDLKLPFANLVDR
ncbi:hypothetical protein CB1_001676013, partial [Camelus ferus]